MLNRIVIMGRLTRDPELRTTQSGISVTSFSLACDRDFKSEGSDSNVDFIDVVAWRQQADFVCKYFRKGQLACVEGRLQARPWTDRDGNKRVSYEIVSDHVYFAEGRRESSESEGNYPDVFNRRPAAEPASPSRENDSDFIATADDDDGELPF